MISQRHRHDDLQPRLGALQVLELAAPGDVVARREAHLFGDRLLRVGDVAADVAAAEVDVDVDRRAARSRCGCWPGPVDEPDRGDLARAARSPPSGVGDRAPRVAIACGSERKLARIAHVDGVALAAFDGGGHRLAAERGRDRLPARRRRSGRSGRAPPGRARCPGSSRRSPARRRRWWCRGRSRTAASISRASRSSLARSGPNTLMPTGVRMPVDSMSMRALIGIVQALADAGELQRLVHLGDQLVRRHARRATRSRGLRLMIVSNISSGAGSVAVSARPALPNTDSTSGNVLMIRSCVCSSSAALVIDRPGSVDGM